MNSQPPSACQEAQVAIGKTIEARPGSQHTGPDPAGSQGMVVCRRAAPQVPESSALPAGYSLFSELSNDLREIRIVTHRFVNGPFQSGIFLHAGVK